MWTFAFKCTMLIAFPWPNGGGVCVAAVRAARRGRWTAAAASSSRRSCTPAWQRPRSALCSAAGTRAPPARSAYRICGEKQRDEAQGDGKRTGIMKGWPVGAGSAANWPAKKSQKSCLFFSVFSFCCTHLTWNPVSATLVTRSKSSRLDCFYLVSRK